MEDNAPYQPDCQSPGWNEELKDNEDFISNEVIIDNVFSVNELAKISLIGYVNIRSLENNLVNLEQILKIIYQKLMILIWCVIVWLKKNLCYTMILNKVDRVALYINDKVNHMCYEEKLDLSSVLTAEIQLN